MATDETDRALVARIQGGDRRAFAVLIERYEPRIRRLTRHLTRGASDADDLAQEAFLRAFQAIDRFDGRSEFFTWLYRIVVNLSLNRSRSMGVRKHVSIDEPDETHSMEARLSQSAFAKSANPHTVYEQRGAALSLLHAMDQLPESLRVTLLFVCVEELPQEQVAEICGCSVGTVAWRVHEARKRLRESMAAQGFEESIDEIAGARANKKGHRS